MKNLIGWIQSFFVKKPDLGTIRNIKEIQKREAKKKESSLVGSGLSNPPSEKRKRGRPKKESP